MVWRSLVTRIWLEKAEKAVFIAVPVGHGFIVSAAEDDIAVACILPLDVHHQLLIQGLACLRVHLHILRVFRQGFEVFSELLGGPLRNSETSAASAAATSSRSLGFRPSCFGFCRDLGLGTACWCHVHKRKKDNSTGEQKGQTVPKQLQMKTYNKI